MSLEARRKSDFRISYLFIVDLDPGIVVGVELSEGIRQGLDSNACLDEIIKGNITAACVALACQFRFRNKIIITTQIRQCPYLRQKNQRDAKKNGEEEGAGEERNHLPYLSNLLISNAMKRSDKLYPKVRKASPISFLSILPEPSRSNAWKQRFQSSMYFHNPANSWKLMVPVPSTWEEKYALSASSSHKAGSSESADHYHQILPASNIFTIVRTVSMLKGLQSPLINARCSSSTVNWPELSVSTALNQLQSCGFAFGGGP